MSVEEAGAASLLKEAGQLSAVGVRMLLHGVLALARCGLLGSPVSWGTLVPVLLEVLGVA